MTSRRRFLTAALLVVLVVALLASVPSLDQVYDRLATMRPGWVALALGLELLSCLAFVAVFRLFFDTVAPAIARRVAWTEMASGALLPGGGVSSLAAGGWLMSVAGQPAARIVRRSSALFFLTSAVNVAALAAGGALLATGLSVGPHDFLRTAVPIAVGLGAIAIALAVARLAPAGEGVPGRDGAPASPAAGASDADARGSRRGWLPQVAAGIREAQAAARRPSWRAAAALGYLGFDIAVLWAALRGLGYAPALGALVVAYLAGYLATWVPIPGGLGVLDGGIAGALVLYGMPPATAVAAVLVYHAIALWVPSAGGLVAYAHLRRKLVQARAEVRAVPVPAPVAQARLAGAAPVPARVAQARLASAASKSERVRRPRALPAPRRAHAPAPEAVRARSAP
jgi:uncharacterized membrane protein YbhN (UPF0104 family)